MNDAALVGVHRLEHNASLVLENLVCLLACKSAEGLLSLCAVALDIKGDLEVIALLALVAAVSRKVEKILQSVKGIAVVTDKNAGSLAR